MKLFNKITIAILLLGVINFFSCDKVKSSEELLYSSSAQEQPNCDHLQATLDDLQIQADTWKWKYDSLLAYCNPVKEVKIETSKPKKKSTKKPKVPALPTMSLDTVDVVLGNILSLEAENRKLQGRLDEANNYMSLMGQQLTKTALERDSLANEAMKVREGQYVDNHIAIRSQSYPDTTIYQFGYMPKVSLEAYRVRKPFWSFQARQIKVVAKDSNPYNIGEKNKDRFITRKSMPKIKK